jgi:hypothetical protein
MIASGVMAAGCAVLPATSMGRMVPCSCKASRHGPDAHEHPTVVCGPAHRVQAMQLAVSSCLLACRPWQQAHWTAADSVRQEQSVKSTLNSSWQCEGSADECVDLCGLCVPLSVSHHLIDSLHGGLHGHQTVLACAHMNMNTAQPCHAHRHSVGSTPIDWIMNGEVCVSSQPDCHASHHYWFDSSSRPDMLCCPTSHKHALSGCQPNTSRQDIQQHHSP